MSLNRVSLRIGAIFDISGGGGTDAALAQARDDGYKPHSPSDVGAQKVGLDTSLSACFRILTGGGCADCHVASGDPLGRGRQADRTVGHRLNPDFEIPPSGEMYIVGSFSYRNTLCNQCFHPDLQPRCCV